MSSREFMITQATEALQATALPSEGRIYNWKACAEAIVETLLPQITSPKQMLGVPEGSILIVEVQAGARALRWEDGFLHGNLRADHMPMPPDWVIERYGPLTLVWTP